MTKVGSTAADVNNANILPFFEKVAQDPALQEKLRKIGEEYPDQAAAKIVELSQEIGLPVTTEELKAVKAATGTEIELSEAELEGVAGGGLKEVFLFAANIAQKTVPCLLQIL